VGAIVRRIEEMKQEYKETDDEEVKPKIEKMENIKERLSLANGGVKAKMMLKMLKQITIKEEGQTQLD